MDKEQAEEIIERLDTVIKLLAMPLIGEGNKIDQVRKLYSIGMTSSQIAKLTGIPLNNVGSYVSRIAKQKKGDPNAPKAK